jgi:4,5-dihydroxyphthalate decarboxylase
MANLKLSFACGPYDRMDAIRDGSVRAEGVDIDYISISSPRELFDRMVFKKEFDASEMSSSETITHICSDNSPFVALPVFPSRVYRHGNIFVSVKNGIKKPKDFEGKRIGVPLYAMTAAIWIKALLADDYGVDLSGITWVQGAGDHLGAHGEDRPPPSIPGVKIVQNTSDKTLFQMLAAGEIDGYIGTGAPKNLGGGEIDRLFPNNVEIEKDYFRRTGIHPIMHLVAIRKEVYERNKWIAKPLYKAFVESKNRAWAEYHNTGANRSMFPWVYDHVAETEKIMGPDPWPYGVEANRKTLETLVNNLHRQGMINRVPRLEDIFVPVD